MCFLGNNQLRGRRLRGGAAGSKPYSHLWVLSPVCVRKDQHMEHVATPEGTRGTRCLHPWLFNFATLEFSNKFCRPDASVSLKHYLLNDPQQELKRVYLRLQPSYDFLPSLHDRVQFSGYHDGQALVFSKRQLNVGPRPLHDVQANLGLLAFAELAVVFVATLLQGHMEHLRSERVKGLISGKVTDLLIFSDGFNAFLMSSCS